MSKWFSDKMKRLTFFVLFALSYHNLIEHKHPEHLSACIYERKTFILILKFCQGERSTTEEKHNFHVKSF